MTRSENHLAPGLKYLAAKFGVKSAVQIVQDLRQPQSVDGVQIVDAASWLAGLAA